MHNCTNYWPSRSCSRPSSKLTLCNFLATSRRHTFCWCLCRAINLPISFNSRIIRPILLPEDQLSECAVEFHGMYQDRQQLKQLAPLFSSLVRMSHVVPISYTRLVSSRSPRQRLASSHPKKSCSNATLTPERRNTVISLSSKTSRQLK